MKFTWYELIEDMITMAYQLDQSITTEYNKKYLTRSISSTCPLNDLYVYGLISIQNSLFIVLTIHFLQIFPNGFQ